MSRQDNIVSVILSVEDIEFILWHLKSNWPFLTVSEVKAERIWITLDQRLKDIEKYSKLGEEK